MPIASLTKMMTAYVILRDHPLAPGETGPEPHRDARPTSTTSTTTRSSTSPTPRSTLGEQLTERQLLEGLLVHSADNFADMLARWDAGQHARPSWRR